MEFHTDVTCLWFVEMYDILRVRSEICVEILLPGWTHFSPSINIKGPVWPFLLQVLETGPVTYLGLSPTVSFTVQIILTTLR